MFGLDIISIEEKQVKIPENVIYSISTSSSKEEEDFRVLLVMDKYTSCFKCFKIKSYFKWFIVSFLGVIQEAFILHLAPNK
jgi:hypothetical protein